MNERKNKISCETDKKKRWHRTEKRTMDETIERERERKKNKRERKSINWQTRNWINKWMQIIQWWTIEKKNGKWRKENQIKF